MESGSNKSLYTLIAIVVFGIFLSLSYFIYQDNLKSVLATVMNNTSQSVDSKLSSSLAATSPIFFDTVTNPQGTLTITSYDTSGGKDVVIPSEINGVPVTTIGSQAFLNAGLTSITLPNTITKIEDAPVVYKGAFTGNNLGFLVIPDSVTYIGGHSFISAGITGLVLGKNVETIASHAFCWNNFKDVIIPKSVKLIGSWTFNSSGLRTVTFEAGSQLKQVDACAFKGNSIVSFTVPASATILGEQIIAHNTTLQTFNVPLSLKSGIVASGNKATAYTASYTVETWYFNYIPYADTILHYY